MARSTRNLHIEQTRIVAEAYGDQGEYLVTCNACNEEEVTVRRQYAPEEYTAMIERLGALAQHIVYDHVTSASMLTYKLVSITDAE